MDKSIRLFVIFLLLAIFQFGFGQKQEKIYYDKEWKGCSKDKASYFALAAIDENGKPIGKVMYYFITGELETEFEGASYIDKDNATSSKFIGKTIRYYKSGKKRYEELVDIEGNLISKIAWYEDGNIESERQFKNGKMEKSISFHQNGKIHFKREFKEGKPIDKWLMECDEFGKCQKEFFAGFFLNPDEWKKEDLDDIESEITLDGLLLKTKSQKGYAQWIHLPIDISSNFSIETLINFKWGENNSAHGLIYGFKDWDNYYYFFISANGKYCIGARIDGLNFDYSKWTPSNHINQNIAKNLIKINKVKDKVYFSINGRIIVTEDFYAFKGNNIGIYIPSGKKEILFENLIVRQDIDEKDASSNASSNSSWKGNGSGFFIDARGYIATNYHVVENATDLEVDFIQNGHKKSYKAKVISSDKQNDLSVIKIDDENFSNWDKLPYNFKTQLSDVGTNVFALGYPMALSIMGDEIKFTDGKISSKTGFKGDITTYQISVPIQPGNSGGPLFDYDGNIVGITNAGIITAENVAYAIKSSYLKNLIDVLPENLNIPNDQTISTKTLTEKIKILSDYVVLIKIR